MAGFAAKMRDVFSPIPVCDVTSESGDRRPMSSAVLQCVNEQLAMLSVQGTD
jgi:hypothetical protein